MAMSEERIQTCLVRAAFGARSKAAPYEADCKRNDHPIKSVHLDAQLWRQIHTIVQQCAEILSKIWAMCVLNVGSMMG